jgi:hypothetical protein
MSQIFNKQGVTKRNNGLFFLSILDIPDGIQHREGGRGSGSEVGVRQTQRRRQSNVCIDTVAVG